MARACRLGVQVRRRRPGDTLVVGLTGSIGMGKSTVSTWLQEMQIPLDDADATVHRLYASEPRCQGEILLLRPGGEAVAPLKEAFGEEVLNQEPSWMAQAGNAMLQEGGIDRQALSKLVVGPSNAENLKKLEARHTMS